jgi:hypothetical protein
MPTSQARDRSGVSAVFPTEKAVEKVSRKVGALKLEPSAARARPPCQRRVATPARAVRKAPYVSLSS